MLPRPKRFTDAPNFTRNLETTVKHCDGITNPVARSLFASPHHPINIPASLKPICIHFSRVGYAVRTLSTATLSGNGTRSVAYPTRFTLVITSAIGCTEQHEAHRSRQRCAFYGLDIWGAVMLGTKSMCPTYATQTMRSACPRLLQV